MTMTEDQIKAAALKLTTRIREEIDPNLLLNTATLFKTSKQIIAESLVYLQDQGEDAFTVIEAATKFMVILTYRSAVEDLVRRAEIAMTRLESIAKTPEEAIALASHFDEKETVKKKALEILRAECKK